MPGLVRGVARTAVVAGTATAVSNRVSRRQANRWAAQEEASYQEQYPPQQYAPPQQQYAPQQYAPPPQQYAPAAPAPDSSELIAQLKQLGELRDQGVLTQAEFEVQKERLLHPPS